MSRREVLFWVVFCFISLGLGFGIAVLVDRHNSDPKAILRNPAGLTDQDAAAQTAVVSETLTFYSKNAAANMEKALNELNDTKPLQRKPAE